MSQATNPFESQYAEIGLASQRRYPNESLLSFVGSNYFSIPLSDRKDISILELGCGSGANLWMLAREGFDCYGIDSSPTGLSLCDEVLDSWGVQAHLEVADMTNLSFVDNQFDLIVDVVSCQHLNLEGHQKCFGEIYRCLKPGGFFFSYHLGTNSTPYKLSQNLHDERTVVNIESGMPLANNGMTCFLDQDTYERLLANAGLENSSFEAVTRTYRNGSQMIEYLCVVAQKKIG